jgi:hypothetical protein
VKIQEDNARAAQEFFANGVRLLQLQGRNAEFVQSGRGTPSRSCASRPSTTPAPPRPSRVP